MILLIDNMTLHATSSNPRELGGHCQTYGPTRSPFQRLKA
jgi:hypothetical protein